MSREDRIRGAIEGMGLGVTSWAAFMMGGNAAGIPVFIAGALLLTWAKARRRRGER